MSLPHKDIAFPDLAVTDDDGGKAHVVHVRERWEETVAEYEANPDGFFESYHYLDGHPAFWRFLEGVSDLPATHVVRLTDEDGLRACVDIQVVKVNPETGGIDDKEELNTATRVWFELGKHGWPPERHQWHDWTLDDGAETYEAAIVLAARKVWENYGNDRRIVDSPEWGNGVDGTVPVVEV